MNLLEKILEYIVIVLIVSTLISIMGVFTYKFWTNISWIAGALSILGWMLVIAFSVWMSKKY